MNQILSRITTFVSSVLRAIFGQFRYSPPTWLLKLFSLIQKSFLGKALQRIKNFKAEQPQIYKKRSRIFFAGFASVVLLSILTKVYLDSRPIPDYVTISTSAPSPTDPETKKPQSLWISFSKSVARPEQLNLALTAGFQMKPELQGTWVWVTDKSLKFTPDLSKGDWAIGQDYTVEFEKKFFASHLIFESHEVSFSTEPLKIQVSKQEFYIDPKNPDIKKVLVNFKTNYPVNVEDFKKRIHFELENRGVLVTSKDVPFTVTANKFKNEVFTQSESLAVPKDSQVMKVKLDKGAKAVAGGPGSKDEHRVSVNVPSLFEGFGISYVSLSFARNDKYEPEQIIVVRTDLDAKTEDVAAALKVHSLPVDKPAREGEALIKNHQWQSLSEVTPDILSQSEKVETKLIPSEQDWTRLHTFKIQVEPNRFLFVNIEKGLKAIGGYQLKDVYQNVIQVSPYPQELSIMSQGSILTLSGDLKLPLLARNVSQVEFTLHRVLPEHVNHLLYQMNGDVQNPSLPYGLESQIAEKFEAQQKLKVESVKATQYFSFDLQPFLNQAESQKGLFLFEVRAKNPDGTFGASDRRLVMVTDIGILVKESVAKSHEVFVQNFRSGLPIEGATVEVVGANGLTVLKSTTNGKGQTIFPDLKEFKNEKRPIAFSVKSNSDQAFLPFRNYTRNLEYSRFDIGGLFESSGSDQLMSMIFSDRGLYRPGEPVNLGLIVRTKKGKPSANKPPMEWSVTDPKGNEILREKIKSNQSDLSDLTFSTEETSPTGVYTIYVYLIKKESPKKELDLLGTQTVRVEEFQPDRLKISSRLSNEKVKGWIKPEEIKAFVSVRNMFGTAAEKRRVKAELLIAPVPPVFSDYKDYAFTNLNKKDEQVYTESLGDQTTNEKGEAEFTLGLNKYQSPLMNLKLSLEAFDSEGGRSVRSLNSVLVSPLDFILGAKADGDLLYISKEAVRNLDVIALDSDLKKVKASEVTAAIIEKKYVSVLTQADDGTYKYQSVVKETPISEKSFSVDAKGSKYLIDTTKPGDFTLVFRNNEKVDVLKINYTVVGESNLAKSLDRKAELQLSLNKSDFKNGEEIEMQIKAPYTGSGLITIERDGVFASKWFKTNSTTTVEKIQVPEGLDGNAYVNVTFLRGVDSTEIYSSPLSFAVAPFSISLDQHKTKIELKSASLVKPGSRLKIQYSASKKTQIILYGVDEGILQVAQYKLPDPLTYFFQKRALQVKTYQMLDLLLPEFSIFEQLQATGGDDGFGAIGKNLNPFKSKRIKPVVFWSGVLQAGPASKAFEYEVPDTFNGNLRIMAVSASSDGLGSIQTDTVVRGDLIITPNVPVFASPQDEFVVGVSVSNQTEGSGEKAQVKLQTTSSSHFSISDGESLTIPIPEGREESREIKVKTLDELGSGELTFQASLDQAKSQVKLEVSVRPSSPYLHFLQTGIFTGADVEIQNKRESYKEYSSVQVQASGSPILLLGGLMGYLENYPYTCTEQLISRSMPLLVLKSMKDYLPDEKKLKTDFLKTIQILRTRQMPDGGFAQFNPSSEAGSNVAISLYAAHYLIESQAKGLDVPADLMERIKKYLQSSAVLNNSQQITQARRWAYALYLSARLGIVNGASLAELKRQLDKDYKNVWNQDVTALYLSGTHSLYRQEDVGEKLIQKFRLGDFKNRDLDDYLDPLNQDAILLYMAGKHYPILVKDLITPESLKKLIQPLNEGRYQTHSVGWLMMAFDVLSLDPGTSNSLSQLKLEIQKKTLEPSKLNPKTWTLANQTSSVKLVGVEGPLFYSFQSSGFDKKQTPITKGLEISKQYRNAAGDVIKEVKMGEELVVHIQARTLDDKTYPQVAIVDLIPAGFEIIAENHNPVVDGGGLSGEGEEGFEEPYEYEEGAFINLLMPKVYAQNKTTLQPMETQFVETREDRMILYVTVTPDLKEFTYRMKAISKGQFQVPPAFAEGMYNRELQFLGSKSVIDVKNP